MTNKILDLLKRSLESISSKPKSDKDMRLMEDIRETISNKEEKPFVMKMDENPDLTEAYYNK
jgi:hypothetical protein